VLAATLQRRLAGRPVRAAVVAASADQACERFARLLAVLDAGASAAIDATAEAGDADTNDLLIAFSRALDKQLWFLEAHLQERE